MSHDLGVLLLTIAALTGIACAGLTILGAQRLKRTPPRDGWCHCHDHDPIIDALTGPYVPPGVDLTAAVETTKAIADAGPPWSRGRVR